MNSPAIRKYLEKYAEPEVALLPDDNVIGQRYQHVLVIPVCDEPQDFLTPLLTETEVTSPVLVILVLNCPDAAGSNAEQDRIQNTTRALWLGLLANGQTLWQAEDGSAALTRHCATPAIDLLLFDRFNDTRRIPHRQGVGLARKIGNDLALALFARGLVKQPWLYNTDADVQLPRDYFTARPDSNASAALYDFEHRAATPELELAMSLYELSLHYYVLGLRWAGSRYAYHSIGSILAINPQRYAEVRGFPKRSGAEDFYLLNKLAKAGRITGIKSAPILISGRTSTRVPFGTGPALNRISELEHPIEEFTFYDPDVFTALKQWLNAVALLWSQRELITSEGLTGALTKALRKTGVRPPLLDTLVAGLESINLEVAVEHSLAQSQHEHTFVQHIHTWFDALRTLQLIHYLRDNGLPSAPFSDSVAKAGFMRGDRGEVHEQDTCRQQACTLCEKIGNWDN